MNIMLDILGSTQLQESGSKANVDDPQNCTEDIPIRWKIVVPKE